MSTAKVNPAADPAVSLAIRKAQPYKPKYLIPILKLLLFNLYFVPNALIRMPWWFLRGLLPFLRPYRGWSIQQTISVLSTHYAVKTISKFGVQPVAPREGGLRERPGVVGDVLNTLNLSGPGGRVTHPRKTLAAAEKVTHRRDRVWFNPPPIEYYRGVLSIRTGPPGRGKVTGSDTYSGAPILEPKWAKTRVRGFWFMHQDGQVPPSKPGKRDRPVFLYFHGGAGVAVSAADVFMGVTLCANLARTSGVDVFSVDYTLAPAGPFPVSICQALAGWLYLTKECGYDPSQIIIGGDSFGAHLTLQLERYMRSELPKVDPEASGDSWPAPMGLLLLSPWLSMDNDPFLSRETNRSTDIIPLNFPAWGIDSMRVGIKWHERYGNRMPYLDPFLSAYLRSRDDYSKLVPTFVANGALEVLVDEGKEFVRRAKEAGAEVKHVIVRGEPHDFFTMPTSIGEARKVYRQVGEWFRQVGKAQPYSV